MNVRPIIFLDIDGVLTVKILDKPKPRLKLPRGL
jgi:hypothetical protein